MATIVCTLYEGEYGWGVGALVNSLYARGFRGDCWIGYRGPLPHWLDGMSLSADGYYSPEAGMRLKFEKVASEIHISQLKPELMLSIFAARPDVGRVMFFDADLVIVAPFAVFEQWIQRGVGLVLDAWMPYVSSAHPLRVAWETLITECGFRSRDSDQYFQSAFVGVSRENIELVERWAALGHAMRQQYPDTVHAFKPKSRAFAFFGTDQDTLAAAVQASTVPLAVVGTEGFGLGRHSWLMQHPAGPRKPWRFAFLRRALLGWAASDPYDELFLRNCRGIVNMLSERALKRQLLTLRVARRIGRFYRA